MLDRLHEFNDIWVVLLFGGSVVVSLLAMPFIGARFGMTVPNKDRGDYVRGAQATLISFTALILAFSLVQVQGNLRKTEELVSKEAGQLSQMDRQLLRYGDPNVAALRSLLWDYVQSIVQDEWPALRAGGPSEETRLKLRPLSRAVFALSPQPGRQTTIYGELLKSLDDIGDLREQRISAAELHLSSQFWYLALGLAVIFILLSLMIEPVPYHTSSIVAQGLAIALLAALVFCTDTPFKGSATVSPAPLEKVLTIMKARTT